MSFASSFFLAPDIHYACLDYYFLKNMTVMFRSSEMQIVYHARRCAQHHRVHLSRRSHAGDTRFRWSIGQLVTSTVSRRGHTSTVLRFDLRGIRWCSAQAPKRTNVSTGLTAPIMLKLPKLPFLNTLFFSLLGKRGLRSLFSFISSLIDFTSINDSSSTPHALVSPLYNSLYLLFLWPIHYQSYSP